MCYCSMCGLPVFSLPLPAFFKSQVEPSLNPLWFSPNSSVIGINLMGGMKGCLQTKRGRKFKIQPDTMQSWLFFNGPGEHFIVFISGLNLNFLCLRLTYIIIHKLVTWKPAVPCSDREQVLQTKCPSVKLVLFCFWRTKSDVYFI